jgi:hypothetical protein
MKENKLIIISDPDYLREDYEELYSNGCSDCRDSFENHVLAIDCSISVARHRIKKLRYSVEEIRAAMAQGAMLRPNCFDPLAHDDEIERIEGYIEFLQKKKSGLFKNTRSLFAKEKYNYLDKLGLFKSHEWATILHNSTVEERERLIAEIIGCDPDTARNCINGHSKLTPAQEEEIKERIDRLKGV